MRGAGGEVAPLTTLLFQGGSPRGRFAGSPQGAAPARSAPLKQERRGATSPPTLPPHNHSLLWCCPVGQGGSPNGPPQLTRPSGASGICCALRACCWDGGYAPTKRQKKARTSKDPHLKMAFCLLCAQKVTSLQKYYFFFKSKSN